MYKYITILVVNIFLLSIMGCASIGTQQEWKPKIVDKEGEIIEKARWVNKERYICKGAGCKVDFKNQTMEGGTLIPSIPIRVNP